MASRSNTSGTSGSSGGSSASSASSHDEHPEVPISPEFELSNPLGSGVAVIRAVVFTPRKFFSGFDPNGDWKAPTVFVLLVAAVTAVLSVLVNVVGVAALSGLGLGEVGLTVLQAALFVVLSPAAVAVAAGVYLLSIKTFIGPDSDFGSTYRMACFAFAPLILGWVPIINAFAVTFALLVVMGVGIKQVYGTTFMTAFITALVSFVPLEVALIWVRVASAGMFSA